MSRCFLAEFGYTTSDITTWVCHPGGPKVIDAVVETLKIPDAALDHTRKSLRDNGNLVVGVGAGRTARQPGGSTAAGASWA